MPSANDCNGADMFSEVTTPACTFTIWGAHLDPNSAWLQFCGISCGILRVDAVLPGNGTVEDTGGTFTAVNTPEPPAGLLLLFGLAVIAVTKSVRLLPVLL